MLPPSMTSARQSQSTLHHCPLVYRPSDESLLTQPHNIPYKLWEYSYLCTHLPRSPPAGEWSWRVSSVQPCNPLPSHQRMRTTSTSGPIRNQLRFWWRFRKRLSYLPSFGLASEYCIWNWEKQQKSRKRSYHQLIWCFVSHHLLCDILVEDFLPGFGLLQPFMETTAQANMQSTKTAFIVRGRVRAASAWLPVSKETETTLNDNETAPNHGENFTHMFAKPINLLGLLVNYPLWLKNMTQNMNIQIL